MSRKSFQCSTLNSAKAKTQEHGDQNGVTRCHVASQKPAFPQTFFFAAFLLMVAFLTNDPCSAQIENVTNPKPETFTKPVLIQFKGPIDQTLSKYIHNKIKQAKEYGADLVVFEIESPGGLKSESLRIAGTMRDIVWAYTVAFIPKEAISGAALVSLGCDEIIVGKNDLAFGDIGEIYWDPESFAFRFVSAKQESNLVPRARNLAVAKGRPPEFAEAMIDKEVQVFRRSVGNGWEYKNVRVEENEPGGDWELIPESGPDRFLTLDGPRMVELGLATQHAETREELGTALNFDATEMRVLKYSSSDKVADFFCSPWMTGLLIIIGLLATYLELSAPGIGVGGLIALMCAALFFWSRFLGGTADWLEAILFMGGVAFLMMEVFVIPGWGFAGIIGLFMMFASVIMAGQDFVLPSNDRQWAEFVTTTLVILCSGAVVILGAALITKKLGSIPIFNRLVLQPDGPGQDQSSPKLDDQGKPIPTSHPLVSVGDWGKSESLLRPAGRAIFAGRSIDVVSDGSYIEPDRQVKVVEIQGNRIVVVEVEDDLSATVARP